VSRAQGSASDVMEQPARTRRTDIEPPVAGTTTRVAATTRSIPGQSNTVTRSATPTRTTRREVPRAPPAPCRSRLGSRQVVTERGRRVAPIKKATLFSRLSDVALALIIG